LPNVIANKRSEVKQMASAKLKMNEKKMLALQYFLSDQFTQKEIAVKLSINETTLSRWVVKENWADLKKSILTTKKEMLSFLYTVMAAIRDDMKSTGDYTDHKKADAFVKYTAAIKNLETETNIGQLMEAGSLFHSFLSAVDPELALLVLNHYDAFIKERLTKRF
jgi:hypothetical protein